MEPVLLSLRDLCKLLGRSSAALERDIACGRLPEPIRLGGARKWRKAEILAWVEAGCPCQKEWAAIRRTTATSK